MRATAQECAQRSSNLLEKIAPALAWSAREAASRCFRRLVQAASTAGILRESTRMDTSSGRRRGYSLSPRHALTALFGLLVVTYCVTLMHETQLLFGSSAGEALKAFRKQVVMEGPFDDAPQRVPRELRDSEFHFVYTSTCTPYQHWQSLVMAHSFKKVEQNGRITRIVSACSEEGEAAVRNLTEAHAPHLLLHFTRDFSKHPEPGIEDESYAPYNKPFGLLDWLHYANPPVTEDIIVLIDPDFLFNRRFVVNSGTRVAKPDDNGAHAVPAQPYLIYSGIQNINNVNDTVTHGTALAQRWSDYMGDAKLALKDSNGVPFCANCAEISRDEGREYYLVGPPYVMTRGDALAMVQDYASFTVKAREGDKSDWMVEMYGYMLGTAKHNIKHTTFDNLALGPKGDDYWGFADHLAANPCDPSTDVPLRSLETPFMMHGCHSFRGTDAEGREWIYYKQLVPEDMFTCDAWMFAQPPPSVWDVARSEADAKERTKKLLQAYGLCSWIKAFNLALTSFKETACAGEYNSHKRLKLIDPRPAVRISDMPDRSEWLVDEPTV